MNRDQGLKGDKWVGCRHSMQANGN